MACPRPTDEKSCEQTTLHDYLASQVVARLESRAQRSAFEAEALTAQRSQLAALEAQRRAAARVSEEALASELSRLDDRAKEERLRQIEAAERAYEVCATRGEEGGA
jgi:hypothetical protein